MNLPEKILEEHSLSLTKQIVKWVGDDKERFAQLAKLFLNGEPLISQRAGWPLSYCVENCPELVKPFIGKFIDNLSKPGHHFAVFRNTMRLFQFVDVPEKYQGRLVNLAFELLLRSDMPPAVKAFSMTVLGNIAKKQPGLKREIETVIKQLMIEGGPAIQSRGKQTLKLLSKLK